MFFLRSSIVTEIDQTFNNDTLEEDNKEEHRCLEIGMIKWVANGKFQKKIKMQNSIIESQIQAISIARDTKPF